MSVNNQKDFSINTIIGPCTSVYGDLESGGFTRIDGNLRGNLTAQGRVVVGEAGRIKSNISGTSITIGGVVYGNVLASERLVILSTGLVVGDIVTRRIQADEGCLIHGKVMVCDTDEKWDQAAAKHQEIPEDTPLSIAVGPVPKPTDHGLNRGVLDQALTVSQAFCHAKLQFLRLLFQNRNFGTAAIKNYG